MSRLALRSLNEEDFALAEGGEFVGGGAMRGMTGLVRGLLAAAVVSAVWAASAQAADPPGTYVVSVCAAETGPVPLAGWRKFGGAHRAFRDTCGTAGGSFGLYANDSVVTAIPFAISWLWSAPQD